MPVLLNEIVFQTEIPLDLIELQREFIVLQFVATMYAAFQTFAPGQEVGVDFNKEYQLTVQQSNER